MGAKYLKAFHINDSKAPFDSHRDLHANIGQGFIGLRGFHNVMNSEHFRNMPLVLETPIDRPDASKLGKTVEDKQVWADEIKLLESLVGMDVEGAEFLGHERRLAALGAGERAKHQAQMDKKQSKLNFGGGSGGGSKKAAAAKKKGKKGKDDDDDDGSRSESD